LQETIDALSQPVERDDRMVGQFDSCGVANGLRLGRHMQSWSDEAPEFADAENVAKVRSTLHCCGRCKLGASCALCRT